MLKSLAAVAGMLVPTFAEAGMSNFRVGGWFGIVAPTGTPRYADQ